MNEITKKKDCPKFNDIFYTKIMTQPKVQNYEFYAMDSVQKIIDFQWISTLMIMKTQFFVYFVFYVCPIWVTLFSQNEKLHEVMLKIAVVPAILLFSIECI